MEKSLAADFFPSVYKFLIAIPPKPVILVDCKIIDFRSAALRGRETAQIKWRISIVPLENHAGGEVTTMANKITVTISGTEYTLMSDDAPSYMRRVADMVDGKMEEIMSSGRVSRMDAAVLAAANLADELLKHQSFTENLRAQLKGYLDDANKAKNELSECKRQVIKLQQRLQQKK